MKRLIGFARGKVFIIAIAAVTLIGGIAIIPVLATSINGPFIVTDNADSFSIAGVGTRSDQNAIIGVGQGTSQQVGVVGTVSGTQSYGLEGIASSTAGAPSFGVVGSSNTANGVYAYTTNSNSAGLYAANLAPSSSGASGSGIDAFTSNPSGFGVFGGNFATANGSGTGVKGVSLSPGGQYASGIGVGGVASGGVGVIGSDASTGTGLLGGTASGVGAAALSTSGGLPLLVIQESATATQPVIQAQVGPNAATVLQLSTAGNLFVSGTITQGAAAVTNTPSMTGHSYGTYSMRGTEANLEDVGQANLVNGQANVALDPVFASTLDMRRGYHVFVMPEGDTRGLFIAAKSQRSFVVRETQGGRSSLAFDYRILGYPYQQTVSHLQYSSRLPEIATFSAAPNANDMNLRLKHELTQQDTTRRNLVKPAALPEFIKPLPKTSARPK